MKSILVVILLSLIGANSLLAKDIRLWYQAYSSGQEGLAKYFDKTKRKSTETPDVLLKYAATSFDRARDAYPKEPLSDINTYGDVNLDYYFPSLQAAFSYQKLAENSESEDEKKQYLLKAESAFKNYRLRLDAQALEAAKKKMGKKSTIADIDLAKFRIEIHQKFVNAKWYKSMWDQSCAQFKPEGEVLCQPVTSGGATVPADQ